MYKNNCLQILVALLPLASGVAMAQSAYPSKAIRVIVPFPPGGGTDIGTRVIAQKLAERFNQQVLVDNRGGAAGIIGTELAAKAPPDGYTLMMGNIGTHAINPSLYSKLPYDPVRDFAPITQAAGLPLFVLTHPSLPVKSARDLIALAKVQPGNLNYSSSGAGGSMHVAAELFQSMANVKLTHVPYKGGGPAVTDLIAGQVSLSFATVLETSQHVRGGRLRALAVTSSGRSVAFPEIATVSEAALPGYESISWLGVFAPAGTSRDIVTRLITPLRKYDLHRESSGIPDVLAVEETLDHIGLPLATAQV